MRVVVMMIWVILMNVNPPMFVTLRLGVQRMNTCLVFRDCQQQLQGVVYCCNLNQNMVDLDMENKLD